MQESGFHSSEPCSRRNVDTAATGTHNHTIAYDVMQSPDRPMDRSIGCTIGHLADVFSLSTTYDDGRTHFKEKDMPATTTQPLQHTKLPPLAHLTRCHRMIDESIRTIQHFL